MSDASGRATWLSRAWSAIAGDDLEPARWLDLVHPDDRERVARVTREAALRRAHYTLAYRLHDAYGWRDVLEKGEPLEADATVAIVHAPQPPTRGAGTLAPSERLVVLGSLVSGLAHEIRTPLAYVENHLTLIESRVARALASDQPARETIADVPGHAAAAHEGVDRINRIVKDLGRFLRLDVLDPREERLDEVVAAALRDRLAAREVAARVEVDLAPTSAAPLDAAQVGQVVAHLVENALEAGGAGAVRVSTRDAPEGPQLVVRDAGVGIPQPVAERMYDPFFTTKPGAAGLGLTIVRGVVELHGGSVACETRVGVGTTFCVTFPPKQAGERRAARAGLA